MDFQPGRPPAKSFLIEPAVKPNLEDDFRVVYFGNSTRDPRVTDNIVAGFFNQKIRFADDLAFRIAKTVMDPEASLVNYRGPFLNFPLGLLFPLRESEWPEIGIGGKRCQVRAFMPFPKTTDD